LLHIANKANFDCSKAREKLETVQGQIETLQEEKVRLTEELEELRLTAAGVSSDGALSNMTGASVDSIELLPPLVRQKLIRLEVRKEFRTRGIFMIGL